VERGSIFMVGPGES